MKQDITTNKAWFFSHDADMRNDIKVKALRRTFGLTGYAVWCLLLETLTASEGYEIILDEITVELLAADYEVTVEQFTEIVEYCKRIGLLRQEGDRLFSANHQRRFGALEMERERKADIARQKAAKRWENAAANTANNENAAAMPQQCRSNATANDENATAMLSDAIIENNIIENNREENKIYPYQGIVDRWNSTCGKILPKVLKLSESRRGKIKARLLELGGEEKWLPTVDTIFRKIVASDFLCGRSGGKGSWTATFDWLFDSPRNWVKILEGNYDNRTQNDDPRRSTPVRPHSDEDYNCDF